MRLNFPQKERAGKWEMRVWYYGFHCEKTLDHLKNTLNYNDLYLAFNITFTCAMKRALIVILNMFSNHKQLVYIETQRTSVTIIMTAIIGRQGKAINKMDSEFNVNSYRYTNMLMPWESCLPLMLAAYHSKGVFNVLC